MVSDTCIQIYNSTFHFEKGIPKNQDCPATSSTTSSTLREPLRTLRPLVVPDGGLEFRAAAAVFELPSSSCFHHPQLFCPSIIISREVTCSCPVATDNESSIITRLRCRRCLIESVVISIRSVPLFSNWRRIRTIQYNTHASMNATRPEALSDKPSLEHRNVLYL
jgi:hypothetical protein